MANLFSFPNPVNEKAARVVAGAVLVAVLVTLATSCAAVDMMARRVGDTQPLYGSDRPVIEPKTTGRDARRQHNGATLLAGTAAAA